jgi:hypothetical protein
MITLKEQEAIDYLERASSCIDVEDKFSNLQLLKALLDIKRGYLQRMHAGVPQMCELSIDASGLPNLSSLLSDVNKAFGDYDNIVSNRAEMMKGYYQQCINADKAGILNESEKLTKSYIADFAFSQTINQITDGQRFFLQKLELDSKIIYNHEGMLVLSHQPTPFQKVKPGDNGDFGFKEDQAISHNKFNYLNLDGFIVPGRAAIKYLDKGKVQDEEQPSPLMFYTILDEKDEVESIRILRNRSPLSARTGSINIPILVKNCGGSDEYSCRTDIPTCHHSAYFQAFPYLSISNLPADRSPLTIQERKLSDLFPALKKTFLQLETAEFPPPQQHNILKVLSLYDVLLRDHLKECTEMLKGTLSPESFEKGSRHFAAEQESLLSLFSNDAVRSAFQLVIPQALNPLMEQIENASQKKTLSINGQEMRIPDSQLEKPTIKKRSIFEDLGKGLKLW